MSGQYGACFCADLEIEGEFYGPCAVCETATVERLAQEEIVRLMEREAIATDEKNWWDK